MGLTPEQKPNLATMANNGDAKGLLDVIATERYSEEIRIEAARFILYPEILELESKQQVLAELKQLADEMDDEKNANLKKELDENVRLFEYFKDKFADENFLIDEASKHEDPAIYSHAILCLERLKDPQRFGEVNALLTTYQMSFQIDFADAIKKVAEGELRELRRRRDEAN